MALTIDLPLELQQVLEDRAGSRGLSLSKHLLDLAKRDLAEHNADGSQPSASANPTPLIDTSTESDTALLSTSWINQTITKSSNSGPALIRELGSNKPDHDASEDV